MKIPRSIKIASHKVKVKVVKNITEPAGVLGYADLTHNLIVLRKEYNGQSLDESTITEVLLHEIIHQVAELYGISLTEKEIRQLGAGLLQVIRDNRLDFLNKD
jgi:hypothetical protein